VSEEPKVTKSLGVWVTLLAGAIAIPVGLAGYTWLEKANLARTGFTQTVRTPGVRVDRACTERSLAAHFGPRQVRSFDDALLVQIPASQYDNRPERVHVVVRGRAVPNAESAGTEFLVETAYYRERALAPRYVELISGAMSEVIDVIARGCAQTDAQRAVASAWTASCAGGAGFAGVCPTLRPGATLPADLRLPVRRD
jgi:hypothetical protein